MEREVGRARVAEDVKRQTEIKIEQHQREFYLRQQLRAIQSELGEGDPGEKEAIETLKKLEEANLPEKAAQEGRREIERMRNLSPASSEYQVIRTYLDWMLALPWNKRSTTDEVIELKKVEELLDSRHYGLKEAKERITLERETFLNSLRRVSLLASDKSNSIKLSFSKNNIEITANTPEVGEARESLPVVYKGRDFSIAFNPEFLMAPLRNLADDEIFFDLIDEMSPGVLKIQTPFLYVLMPMRVSA